MYENHYTIKFRQFSDKFYYIYVSIRCHTMFCLLNKAELAGYWARMYPRNAKYKITKDLYDTQNTYCSKIVYQAYSIGLIHNFGAVSILCII